MDSRSSANVLMFDCSLFPFVLPDSMAQSLRGRNPDIVPLKIDAENVVVGRRSCDRYRGHLSLRIADRHLRLAGGERIAVDSPVGAVVIGQAPIGAEPGPVGVQTLHLVGEVRGKSAVFGEQ